MLHPPLANEFFSHSLFAKLGKHYEPLIDYLRNTLKIEVDANDHLDIELLFTQIESTWQLKLHEDFDAIKTRFGDSFILLTPIEFLRSYVTDIIYFSTRWLKKYVCPFHGYLAQRWLSPGDLIIDFNYDLIMDCALKRNTSWNERAGYGFESLPSTGHEISRLYNTSTKSNIELLKPHGSLNWFKAKGIRKKPRSAYEEIFNLPARYDTDDVLDNIAIQSIEDTLRGKTPSSRYTGKGIIRVAPRISRQSVIDVIFRGGRTHKMPINLLGESRSLCDNGYLPLMILPTPYKSFNEMTYGQLKELWRKIRNSIEHCAVLLVCDYSFRDPHFNQLLLEISSIRESPLLLETVGIDRSAILKIRKQFKGANIRVDPFYGTLEEFVRTLGYVKMTGRRYWVQ